MSICGNSSIDLPLGLKRWSFVIFLGLVTIGMGLLILFNHLSRTELAQIVLYWTTFQMWPFWARSLLFVAVGLAVTAYGAWRLHGILFVRFWPELRRPENVEAINTLLRSQRRREGPKIVAIGGGTGMPQLLRGLRKYTDNITAIVTVADDGGSSGRLRRQLGMLPPGDFRNNIAALSDSEGLMKRLFQYRFAESDVARDGPDQRTGRAQLRQSLHHHDGGSDGQLRGRNHRKQQGVAGTRAGVAQHAGERDPLRRSAAHTRRRQRRMGDRRRARASCPKQRRRIERVF